MKAAKGKGLKALLPHEKELLASNQLQNVTHSGSSSIWLSTESTVLPADDDRTTIYRPMGDTETLYLVKNNKLPDTQPYQTIVEGENGREYCEKYLTGKKWVDSCPTTIVEFLCPKPLIKTLFEIQHKPEDGIMSMGLGNKAGKGLGLFNDSLSKKRNDMEDSSHQKESF